MAYQSATGKVTGLYASTFDRCIRIDNVWWECPQTTFASGALTIAAAARGAGTPVLIASDKATGYFLIQSL